MAAVSEYAAANVKYGGAAYENGKGKSERKNI